MVKSTTKSRNTAILVSLGNLRYFIDHLWQDEVGSPPSWRSSSKDMVVFGILEASRRNCCMMEIEDESSVKVLAKRALGNVLMFWLPRRFLISIKRKTTGMGPAEDGARLLRIASLPPWLEDQKVSPGAADWPPGVTPNQGCDASF